LKYDMTLYNLTYLIVLHVSSSHNDLIFLSFC
jgi:hypothetical protein